jgi:hypothetical protein
MFKPLDLPETKGVPAAVPSVATNMLSVADVRFHRRSGPARIEVTETAITGEYMRPACFE